jgi:hypothetical protein
MVKGKGHVICLLKHTSMTARELELMFSKSVIQHQTYQVSHAGQGGKDENT